MEQVRATARPVVGVLRFRMDQTYQSMARLGFPEDEIVGTLDWAGADDSRSPILATGVVDVPDGEHVSLDVMHVVSVEPSSGCSSPLTIVGAPKDQSPGWLIRGDCAAVDLRFLRHLPSDVIDSLELSEVVPESFAAIVHLTPGLTHL